MDDLIAWYRVRLDAEERAMFAQFERDGVWVCDDCGGGTDTADGLDDHLSGSGVGGHRPGPGRVLREVEAKRRIIEECERAIRAQGIYGEDGQGPLAEDVLRLLALPYADWPGYRDEWRP